MGRDGFGSSDCSRSGACGVIAGRGVDRARSWAEWFGCSVGRWRERAPGRRVGAAFVAVLLIASSLGLSGGTVVAQDSEQPEDSESASSGEAAVEASPAVWWDGTATLAAAAPLVTAQGECGPFEGSLALFAGAPLSEVCAGEAPAEAPGPVSGSPRGVGWFEGFDADGLYAGVELLGAPDVAAGVYRALGAMDVIFDGGTFSIDSSECAHRAEAGYSSCRIRAAGVPLPPGAFVGVAVPGTEAPPRGIVGAGSSAATPAAERAALVALYNATKGANWTRKTNWNTAAAVSTWYGVTTNSDGSVTYLYLSGNDLSGTIPAAVGELTKLEHLSLSDNELSGSIPAALGDLSNLVTIGLWSNELSGGIPVELGGLGNLLSLRMWSNALSGPIPTELGDLADLQVLQLDGNNLSGPIPTELGDLTDLATLSLTANSLSGPIPAVLGDLTNLRKLQLVGNDLSGPIPAVLGDLTNLRWLFLGANSLSGPIPAVLGDLSNLEKLDLDHNDLSGSIPGKLGELANLQDLWLNDNELSGPIPAVLGDLTNLERLFLSNNELSGSIPAVLGNLAKLRSLWLSGNSFTGCVPAALAKVTNISFDPDLSYCAKPVLVGAVLVDGDTIELVFDADLGEAAVPAAGAFAVSVNGERRDVTAVSVSGRKVMLELRSMVESTQTVTVSYTVPATGTKIQSPDGQAADGFSDQAVVFPPDAPTLTGVESTTGGLTVSWGPVTGVSGYEVAWRPDGETAWQSTRTGIRQRYTIGGLGDGVLYWVRVRAVKTAAGSGGRTFSVTSDWSAPDPQIVGDWAPQDLEVTPGDQMLTLTWDDVPVASGYEVEYWPSERPAESGTADAVRGEDGWSAYITGLENGVDHDVRVRAVRNLNPDAVLPPSYDRELVSAWANSGGRPGILFRVAESDPPRFARGGNTVTRSVTLTYAGDAGLPFAYRDLGVDVREGPSSAATVRCRVGSLAALSGLDDSLGSCRTGGDGMLKLVYTAGPYDGGDAAQEDEVRVFVDSSGDGAWQGGEPFVDLAALRFAWAANLVALGDSYSAGENGAFRAIGGFGPGSDGGYYLTDNPAAFDCRRWNRAYGRLLPSLDSKAYEDVDTYACTSAISLNIFDPDDADGDGLHDTAGPPLHPRIEPGSDRAKRRTIETNRPSPRAEAYVWPPPTGGQAGDWEPRQALSLSRANARQTVDMVTLTIGGNDAHFADVLRSCYVGGCADRLEATAVSALLGNFGDTLTEVFEAVKSAAPDAAVFVLGYPYLTPFSQSDYDAYVNQPARERRTYLFEERDACDALNVYPLLGQARFFGVEADFVIDLLNALAALPDLGRQIADFFGGDLFSSADPPDHVEDAANLLLKIDTLEKYRLKEAVEALNGLIRSRAAEAGIHYVDVLGAFGGHDQCGGDPWLNGLVVDARSSDDLPLSGRSFHPNAAGHDGYADALVDYIAAAVERGVPLNAAGLPSNPPARRIIATEQASGEQGERGAASRSGATQAGGQSSDAAGTGAVGNTVLWARRTSPATVRCGGFLAPGDTVGLSAGGFAAGSSVSFSTVAATVSGGVLPAVAIPAATADTDGRISVSWTVPAVLAGEDPSTPRAYFVKATGSDASSAPLVAFTPGPMVAYPGSSPCAFDDAATTSVGESVRISVVANDTAPADGSLDVASVSVAGARGGAFAVNAADGSLTFTPEAGFVGVVSARYRVADNWGLRVGATVTVTVNAGCTITGTAGVAEIAGTDGDDVICVPDPKDRSAFHIIDAKAGDDVVLGGDGVEWVHGGAGADTIYGAGGADEITGGPDADTIHGGAGFDTIHSRDLVDAIIDRAGGYELLLAPPAATAQAAPVANDDVAYAATGETLDISVLDNDFDPDENLVEGSLRITRAPAAGAAASGASLGGALVIRYTAGETDGVDSFAYEVCDTLGACATAEVTVTVGTSHCTIVGTDGDDILRGTPGDDVICGLGGHDVISGLGGNDILIGGPGNDALYGGHPIPVGAGDGENVLFGGPGHDTLVGGGGSDTIWGGPGDDTMWGNDGVDTLLGGLGDDRLTGGDGDDIIWGGPGDDTAWGHAGADALHGGPGDDTLTGSGGDDTIWGGPGVDRLSGHGGDDVLWGGLGADLLWGNLGDDTLWGGPGDDALVGGDGDDELHGGAGDDTLTGDGPESLLGGADRLWGGSGDDSLDGGAKSDYLDGGPDVDTCTRGESAARCG